MLISFLKKGVYGYLRDDQLGIHGFVSNNNLAVRKAAALRAGGYDDALRIAEDFDLCQRVMATGGLLYFCPEVALEHRARPTVRALLRQWWNYGFHLARNHARHHPGRLLVALRAPRWDDREAAEPVRSTVEPRRGARGPTVLLFLSPFAVLHAALLGAIVAGLAGADGAARVAGLVAAASALAYVRPDFRYLRADGLRTALGLCALRYAVNVTFVGAGLAGGLTRWSLYVLPPIAARFAPARSDA
jgi:hypothetical protein